jgi:hypothetical protein
MKRKKRKRNTGIDRKKHEPAGNLKRTKNKSLVKKGEAAGSSVIHEALEEMVEVKSP